MFALIAGTFIYLLISLTMQKMEINKQLYATEELEKEMIIQQEEYNTLFNRIKEFENEKKIQEEKGNNVFHRINEFEKEKKMQQEEYTKLFNRMKEFEKEKKMKNEEFSEVQNRLVLIDTFMKKTKYDADDFKRLIDSLKFRVQISESEQDVTEIEEHFEDNREGIIISNNKKRVRKTKKRWLYNCIRK